MKNRWTLKELIAIGSMSVLMLILMIPGAILNSITPFRTGGLNSLVYTIFIVLCLFIIDKFGASTIMLFLFGILALPLDIVTPPGVFFKVIILTGAGLIGDIVYLLTLRKKKLFALIIGTPILYYLGLAIVFVVEFFGMKNSGLPKNYLNLIVNPFIFLLIIFVGAIGGLSGYFIFQKIKYTSVIKRIQR